MPTDVLLERFQFESDLIARTARRKKHVREKSTQKLCQDLPTHAREAWEALWEFIRLRTTVNAWQEVGEDFLTLLDINLEAVGLLEKAGAQLSGVQVQLEQLRQEHIDRWPWFREEEVEQALAEDARGETLELDEAFARAAGVRREEWVRRVEERERLHQQGGE